VDDFVSLSNRLLSRCPAAGISLSEQLINDSWHQLQSRREWSWRRCHGTFAPPAVYTAGTVSSNVGIGQPTMLTGIGTAWTLAMIGRQIRAGGLMFPYYTVVGWLSPTSLLIDQPWAGPDIVSQPYQMLQCYFPVPSDFGYFQVVVSVKDGYRLWTNMTQSDLGLMDPQRTNTGQTYAVALRDYQPILGGTIGSVIPVAAAGAAPVSTTTLGYSYVSDATYIIQVVGGGISGVATFRWMRAGQTAFTGPVVTSDMAADLMDGVQVYWPDAATYVANDLFVVNAQASAMSGNPRYELWPAPTIANYLYPYLYVAREWDLTQAQPQLPYPIAQRGEVLLEMALAKCARYPGADTDHPNPYFNLTLALQHDRIAEQLLNDLERNDEEIGVTTVSYQEMPFYPAPWMDGAWEQSHAPFLRG
jgi:hypothetical protein